MQIGIFISPYSFVPINIYRATDFPKKVKMYLPVLFSRSLLSKKRAYHIVKEVS